MARGLYVAFGALAYTFFFLTFLYLIAFVGNLPEVPRTVDRGGPEAATGVAVAVDLLLIALFGVQHSIMARPGFKAGWTRIVPEAIERSTYVLVASAILWVLYLFWHPIPGAVWHVTSPVGAGALWALFGAGWLIVLLSTFLIDHFELFGLAQVWRNLRGRKAAAPVFRKPFFYKLVRHPLYTGFILAFWATPLMSWGHLLLAAGMTAYILIAIRYEERDLVGVFGADYEQYTREVGMLAPGIGKRR